MALPKALESMLKEALESSSLSTGSIFQDRDGCINFELKFDSETDLISHNQ